MAANKLTMAAVLLLAIGGAAAARDPKPESEMLIQLIDSDRVGGLGLPMTKAVASGILARAGVRLRWQDGRSRSASGSTIAIRFLNFAPNRHSANDLAEALPYAADGVRITVFLDRVASLADHPLFLPRVLGHVLAHEIGHVLRGTNAHSQSGVMKAHWDYADCQAMRAKGLQFAAEDVSAIELGRAR